ncbi:DUF2634 domain-containing protein [Clostridium magnum]|uniref:DUF2634 domain-containing protein n=1 Tax=Clostridium magnum DSM 2767 TaxID=1121326 RepID=A0A162UX73_9CLOT|nr:DUF2634 domain-containing protein [Clostridium magnum]KZL94375.1 hypothetical protein CLMAG_14280 [Clostridium magnum DSM 2767]SHJ50206.1 Protein of unknown function [Clostridium magnum DSM 2767]
MSIFPSSIANVDTIIDKAVTATATIPREYAWDFENNEFRLVNGKFVIVEGPEALKIWMWKALKTVKMTYSVYSDSYGHDLDTLVGQGFSSGMVESEARRLVLECISANSHITGIKNFSANSNGDTLTVGFTALTDQGEVTYSGRI